MTKVNFVTLLSIPLEMSIGMTKWDSTVVKFISIRIIGFLFFPYTDNCSSLVSQHLFAHAHLHRPFGWKHHVTTVIKTIDWP